MLFFQFSGVAICLLNLLVAIYHLSKWCHDADQSIDTIESIDSFPKDSPVHSSLSHLEVMGAIIGSAAIVLNLLGIIIEIQLISHSNNIAQYLNPIFMAISNVDTQYFPSHTTAEQAHMHGVSIVSRSEDPESRAEQVQAHMHGYMTGDSEKVQQEVSCKNDVMKHIPTMVPLWIVLNDSRVKFGFYLFLGFLMILSGESTCILFSILTLCYACVVFVAASKTIDELNKQLQAELIALNVKFQYVEPSFYAKKHEIREEEEEATMKYDDIKLVRTQDLIHDEQTDDESDVEFRLASDGTSSGHDMESQGDSHSSDEQMGQVNAYGASMSKRPSLKRVINDNGGVEVVLSETRDETEHLKVEGRPRQSSNDQLLTRNSTYGTTVDL